MIHEASPWTFKDKEQELTGAGANEKEEGRHDYVMAANRLIRGHMKGTSSWSPLQRSYFRFGGG